MSHGNPKSKAHENPAFLSNPRQKHSLSNFGRPCVCPHYIILFKPPPNTIKFNNQKSHIEKLPNCTRTTSMAAPRCTATKPSRSDIVLDNEEQMRITDQIRAQFDSIAPKRPMKPSRSESDSLTENPSGFTSEKAIPELDKFRNLQSQSHVLFLVCYICFFLRES